MTTTTTPTPAAATLPRGGLCGRRYHDPERHAVAFAHRPVVPVRCPVMGHSHDLELVSNHTQDGTGSTAQLVQCAGNGRRWFLVEGRSPSKFNRAR